MDYLQNSFRGLKPYDFEPERRSKSEPSNSHVASSGSTENIEQRNTLHWCKCGSCRKEFREIDCLCCEEMLAIREDLKLT